MTILLTTIVTVFEVLGILSALSALLTSRTSQGAIAWVVSLLTIPIIAVPLYWIFGRTKFHGYISARQTGDAELAHISENVKARSNWDEVPANYTGRLVALKRLAKMPFTHGNAAEILVDGEATFNSIFAGMEKAQDYILVQFFIFKDDQIGKVFKEKLLAQVKRGIRIYLLYDEIGSRHLHHSYFAELRAAGIHVSPFHSTRGFWNRFQLNFRNHRKIVIVDGKIGWIGGHNVGDEYLGRYKKFGRWRDTHIRIDGPAVLGIQLSFVEDWNWATDEKLRLNWEPTSISADGLPVLILPSGPADEYDTASLMIQQAIQAAQERFWLTTPYFVPDEGVSQALHLAALRGVDVRILIPDTIDHVLPYLSAFSFVGEMIKSGIKIYRYKAGFLHEKVFLIDNDAAAIGTVNLDNRSFRLNFEITVICLGEEFAARVEQMLLDDFSHAREMTLHEIKRKPLWFKLVSRASYLAAPVQ